MGIGFNWFKKYEIQHNKILHYDEYRIKLIDSDSTSHSYHNSWLVTDLSWKKNWIKLWRKIKWVNL